MSSTSFNNLKKQISDATQFLTLNQKEIKRLVKFKSVESVELDFPVHVYKAFVQESAFPAELIALAGGLGLSITASQYYKEETRR